jgi:hypothetical protein
MRLSKTLHPPPLILFHFNVVRLFGHQSLPSKTISADLNAGDCSINSYQGIFSSLLSQEVLAFYRSGGMGGALSSGGPDFGRRPGSSVFQASLFARPSSPFLFKDADAGPSRNGNAIGPAAAAFTPLFPPAGGSGRSAQAGPNAGETAPVRGLTGNADGAQTLSDAFVIPSDHGPLS